MSIRERSHTTYIVSLRVGVGQDTTLSYVGGSAIYYVRLRVSGLAPKIAKKNTK